MIRLTKYYSIKNYSIAYILLMLLTVAACSKDDDGYRLSPGGGGNSGEVTDAEGNNDWVNNPDASRLEVPAIRHGKQYKFIVHKANASNSTTEKVVNFCLEYDSASYHSRWVAFRFDDKTRVVANGVGRSEAWGVDPDLPEACQLPTTAYSGKGYSRGHLCASFDRQNSTEANQQTFYMSNMSPQLYDFNGGYWATLEQGIQKWARSKTNGEYKYKNIYVCKGGTIKSNQIKTSFNTYNVLGRSVKVPVPAYYFMAILAETRSGSFQAVGFLMEHKNYTDDGGTNYSSSNYPPSTLMKQHAMSIDQLEDFTGINFFCNLSDAIEEVVESSYASTQWDWNWK